MKTTVFIYAAIIIIVLTFKIWLFGSLTTSGIKAVAGSCHKTYAIEKIPIISGNWFCTNREEK